MRIRLFLLAAALLRAQDPVDVQGWMNRGVQAFRSANYPQATADFQKAVEIDPSSVTARLYLATAYMQQYIPGAATPTNDAIAASALDHFQQVLALDSQNKVAIASIASLYLNQKKWADARSWYQRLSAIDPSNPDGYYSLAFIDWSEWYPAYMQARTSVGMQNGAPGPIPSSALRQNLQARYGNLVEDGIANLRRALELRPDYDDAMAYMNLFYRERADLRDTPEDYRRDIAEADQWMQKALATKQQRSQPNPPERIRMNGNVPMGKLTRHVDPVYPPLAAQARIQGTVRLGVTISREGTVQNITVVSGHPLLVPAAIDAVKQWEFQPTLLNGSPVEVLTEIGIDFPPIHLPL